MATLENGFIKIYRQMVNWEWYQDLNVFRLFTHLLLTVNYEDKKWQGITIPRGSKVTSLNHLAEETGLSVRQVRVALDKLKMTNEVTSKTTNKYTLISVVKYSDFQDNKKANGKQDDTQDDKRVTNERQTNDKQMTTMKEYIKKDKKDKKDKEVKNIYGEFQNVKLTETEYEKLITEYGTSGTLEIINILDTYKGSSGKKYQSDYLAIRNWVIKRYQEDKNKKQTNNNTNKNLFAEILKEEGVF